MTGAVGGGLRRLGVIGCGLMGAGLAELGARSGFDVVVAVSSDRSLRAGRERVLASLDRSVAKGRIGAEDRDAAVGRLSFTDTLGELADRELIIESVTESHPVKAKVFAALDAVLPKDHDVVLATNTSSLAVAGLAASVRREDLVVGTHFFNPVGTMPLVELISSPRTAPEAAARAERFLAEGLGKRVVHAPDRPGFVVNALLVPFMMSAITMLESGHATAEDIDAGMTQGCGHPMGPLALSDFTGLDTLAAVAQGLFEQSDDARYRPPRLLLDLVTAGHLGRKSGRGFYEYA
ncbi:3-hydroxybutyryl-CoA dehydrogenase [Kitasatospora brasiliensis]|uniref:3-hydroxybutyryl-CoA dehydrogenase n=1 Tax=Kitasatospora brasiliensis TaxID=3058040 RepID=UPI00292CAA9B|nr:3-hydroxybutyryl-CoA dehydrogenase [Kitasatospora sp. K002]